MSLRENIDIKGITEDNHRRKNRRWHSRFYHNQFEGWTEESVPKKNGRGFQIVRTYTGKYYRQELTKKERIILRFIYITLFIVAAICYGVAACMDVRSNFICYAVLPSVFALPSLFCIFISFLSYIPAGELMKNPEYKNGVRWLRVSSLISTICLMLTVFTSLIFIALNPETYGHMQLVYEILFLVAGGATFAIWTTERRIRYTEVPNDIK